MTQSWLRDGIFHFGLDKKIPKSKIGIGIRKSRAQNPGNSKFPGIGILEISEFFTTMLSAFSLSGFQAPEFRHFPLSREFYSLSILKKIKKNLPITLKNINS